MQTINSLIDIANSVDVFFIDVFGVLWSGEAFYPDALNVCEQLMRLNKCIYILSNATTINEHFKEKHTANGFIQGIHYTDVITSGDVLKNKLDTQHFLDEVTGSEFGKYLLVGRPNDKLLASVLSRQTSNIDEAKAIYLGALQTKDSTQDIHYATIDPFVPMVEEALKKGLPAICSNPDYFAFHGTFRHVTQGSLGKWYEEHGGKVYWIGKPYQNIYDYALKIADVRPDKCAMVGDTIRTDILGGQQAGMKTVLILETGITQDLLNKGATLQDVEKEEGATPDYILKGLR